MAQIGRDISSTALDLLQDLANVLQENKKDDKGPIGLNTRWRIRCYPGTLSHEEDHSFQEFQH